MTGANRTKSTEAQGRVVSRRESLAMLGAAAAAIVAPRGALAATARPGDGVCVVRPAQTEGPFFVADVPERTDIRSDPATGARAPGTPLQLAFLVSTLAGGACAPLAGARVDVWQCDAEGRYSGAGGYGPSTARAGFLRGFQTTDAAGAAAFLTVYPGAYSGRAVHIHFKVRTAAKAGRAQEFTSQIYFDDAFSDRVYAAAGYPLPARRMRNGDDWLYRNGGAALTVRPAISGDAIAARFDVALAPA